MKKTPAFDIAGELSDRDAVLDAPDVGLGQDQLVEGNPLRRREDQLGLSFSHDVSPWRAAGRLSPGLNPP